jgi:hypothetical protein
MALLTLQDASGNTGATITYGAAGASDTAVGGQGRYLCYRNAAGAPITVTIATPEVVDGDLAVAERTVTVTNGTDRHIPLPRRFNDATTGLATITTSSQTSITVALVQGSFQA